tara:strand:+ start:2602 stop:2838 length:237 start_codon:yes stop_codon:yes gene_type:complete
MADDSTKNVVTINGEEFSRDTMSDQQNYIIEQCRDLQAKRQQAQFQVDQLSGALDFFTKALIESVSDGSKEETDAAVG